MAASTQQEAYPNWFLAVLAVAAGVLLLVAGYLWLIRPPLVGPLATIPTPTARPAERPTVVVEVTITPGEGVGATATPGESVGVTTTPEEKLVQAPTEEPQEMATATPPGAVATGTITGRVRLEARKVYADVQILVNNEPAGSTDGSGAFQVDVPAGVYTVRARHLGYVPAEASAVRVRAGQVVRLADITLPAGDTDADEDVDLFDMVRCAANLRRPPPPGMEFADINGDGIIDIREIVIIHRNYRTVRPVVWLLN